MTNKDALKKAIHNDDYIEFCSIIQKLIKAPCFEKIDFKKFFDADAGETYTPSYLGEKIQYREGDAIFDAILLEECSMFGEPYVQVIKDNSIKKIPRSFVVGEINERKTTDRQN